MPQVLGEIKSEAYQSILEKTAKKLMNRHQFTRSEIEKLLDESEKKKFGNFLQRMKELNVLKQVGTGKYEFTNSMATVYLWLYGVDGAKKASK